MPGPNTTVNHISDHASSFEGPQGVPLEYATSDPLTPVDQ